MGYRKKILKCVEKKYNWITDGEANEKIMNFCKGLNVLSLCPKTNIENDDSFRFLGIYSKNIPEWLLSYFGTVRHSIAIAMI